MLPYTCYLRVYEPADPPAGGSGAGQVGPDGSERVATTVSTEQREALLHTVHQHLALDARQQPRAAGYVLTREGRDYVCPVELPLRTWVALGQVDDALGEDVARLLVNGEERARADAAFVRWRRDHTAAVPHIRQATWGVPRVWFLLVVEDEREMYDVEGRTTLRYRARLVDARRRLARAQSVLHEVIEDLDLHDELGDLRDWLESFEDGAWLELDYAGVGWLLGDALAADRSARDVHTALRALRAGDVGAAGTAYRRFEERWRAVNAMERAS